MADQFDMVVIGAGSGGVRAARIAAGYGAKVALIEPQMQHGPPGFSAVGGTCVNVGCVPKKLMVYGSEFSAYPKTGANFGWNFGTPPAHDWAQLMANKDREISRLNGIYLSMLKKAGVELIEGWGRVASKDSVVVGPEQGVPTPARTLATKNILIAVGGWPFVPDMPGKEHCITSNEIFYLKERPKRMVVIGGGYIAVEFACIMHGYGVEVTLLYRGPLFLRGFDDSVRAHLSAEMQKNGVNIRFNCAPQAVEKQADGSLVVVGSDGSRTPADQVLVATGRKARCDGLGLEAAGVATTKGGGVQVDMDSRTNVEGIYAVGDVTDRIQLTPVALAEGHCLADTIFGKKPRTPSHDWVASAVFSQPQIGSCGFTEAKAAEKYRDLRVYESTFRPMKYTIIPADDAQPKVYMKLIVDEASDRVVGCHMCGPDAGEIMQGIGIAMKMGATKADFDNTIGIHPTSAEEFCTMRTPSYLVKGGEKVKA
eukprot:TRINITY_DN12119_c0_g1_i1.p1 TRINITY_DN12119_c0_g1~~TRINITY_DN12119_c0_g1_i1.p1  ORF type:complete len:522 (+),score=203.34 TRINITY_DN12119_c0_g1_i1:123-1568(+)